MPPPQQQGTTERRTGQQGRSPDPETDQERRLLRRGGLSGAVAEKWQGGGRVGVTHGVLCEPDEKES